MFRVVSYSVASSKPIKLQGSDWLTTLNASSGVSKEDSKLATILSAHDLGHSHNLFVHSRSVTSNTATPISSLHDARLPHDAARSALLPRLLHHHTSCARKDADDWPSRRPAGTATYIYRKRSHEGHIGGQHRAERRGWKQDCELLSHLEFRGGPTARLAIELAEGVSGLHGAHDRVGVWEGC